MRGERRRCGLPDRATLGTPLAPFVPGHPQEGREMVALPRTTGRVLTTAPSRGVVFAFRARHHSTTERERMRWADEEASGVVSRAGSRRPDEPAGRPGPGGDHHHVHLD